jgi:hypothetical protein
LADTKPGKGISDPRMSFKQILTPVEKLSTRHRNYAEILAQGELSKAEAMRRAGFSKSLAAKPDFIGPTRDKSRYPFLFDYYLDLRRRILRLYDVTAETVRDELRLIAFSKLTDFIHVPTRRDLQRQALFDAKMRKGMGYSDPEDEALIAQEDELRQELSGENRAIEKLRKFSPGRTVKLKAYEDIPEELLPAIASIKETRDGIEIKLHNKLEALDRLARILKLYDDPQVGDKPTTIETLNVIVNGTKSSLLDQLDKI